jgi:hypothetical protein
MGPAELLRWQWANYPGTHTTRANLLLHICTMPFFWVGTLLLLAGLLSLSWLPAVLGFACLLVPLIAQGLGHRRLEPMAPAPFTSPWNFVARLTLEQWITFPRYVLSGGWGRAYRDAR